MSSNTHTISVGSGGQHVFEPDTVYAKPGDLITFMFYPTNHSVVRGLYTQSKICGSSGCNPCVPYELYHPNGTGFYSGNILTQDGSGHDVTFNLTINDTSPIWFYCSAVSSCSSNGMVGVINPAYGTSAEVQREAAINARLQLSPGESWPAEGSATTLAAASSSSSTSIANGSEAALSSGAIAGIVIAAALPLAAAVVFIYRRAMSRAKERVSANTAPEGCETPPPTEMPAHDPVTAPSDLISPVSPSPVAQNMVPPEKLLASPPEGHPALRPSAQHSQIYELDGQGK